MNMFLEILLNELPTDTKVIKNFLMAELAWKFAV